MFARLNGWAPRWRHGASSERYDAAGDGDVSVDGKPLRFRHGLPKATTLEAVALSNDDANMLQGLVDVGGHHFPCDLDAHAESGLGPDTPALGNWSIEPSSTTVGVHGIGYLLVTTSIVWDPSLPSKWTVMLWRNVAGVAEHVAVTSGGRKLSNGVRNDLLNTNELTVSNGAVALAAGAYDDIVVVPYELTDEFIASFFRWTTGRSISFAIYFGDGSGRDVVGLTNNNTPSSTGLRRTGGRWDGCVLVTTAAESLSYPSGAGHQVFGRAGFSVEDWVWLDTDIVAPGRYLADGGVITLGTGWDVVFSQDTDGTFRVIARAMTSGGLMAMQSKGGPKIGIAGKQWAHVVATFDTTTGRAIVYINGVAAQVEVSSPVAPGSTFSSDTTRALRLGATTTLTLPLCGRSSGLRCYGTVLTPDEVLEHCRAGLEGNVPTMRRPFSPLPALELTGDLTGGRPVLVLAQTADQPIVQRSRMKTTEKAWVNNARDVGVVFDQVIDRDVGRLPEPLWAFTLGDPYYDGANIFRPAGGDLGVGAGFRTFWSPGPLLRDGMRARSHTAINDRISLTAEHGACVFRQSALSVIAWVKPGTFSTIRGIASMALSSTVARWTLSTNAAGQVVLAGRGALADTTRTQTSTTGILADRWHMVGGFMDVGNNQMGVFADGMGLEPHLGGFFEVGAQVFTSTRMSAEVYAPYNAIGVGFALGSTYVGDVAHVALYRGRLTAAEALRIYRAGLRGIFR